MTVPIQIPIIQYIASGSTSGPFAFPFKITVEDDLQIFLNGVRQTSGYIVTGIGSDSGGDVTFGAIPTAGTVILIKRYIPLERVLFDYQTNGDLLANTVNADFDRIWMALQDVGYYVGNGDPDTARALLLGDGDVVGAGAYHALQNRIQDLADAANPQDAVNLRTMQQAIAAVVSTGGGDLVMTILANSTDPTLGVSLIGGAGRVVGSISALRSVLKNKNPNTFVTSYYGDGNGGGGPYSLDPTDITSPDNGGTVIVASDGGRWKLQHSGSVSARQFGVKIGSVDSSSSMQAAITAASQNAFEILIDGQITIASPISFPSNARGCTVRGTNRQSSIKFTGTGNLLSGLSASHVRLQNLTIVGPGSSTATTAISLQTSDSSKGVYYCVFEDLTIEGFQTGMSIAGLCEPVFRKVNIGLSKSGLFTGTDAEAAPEVGIEIGTTVLAASFYGCTIFAKRRCVSQTTQQQLCEGHYYYGCTFDLAFNNGGSNDQSAVYYESGQDVVFTSCWLTNTQKYSGTSQFLDNILRINYNPGAINAPLVSFKFLGCTFAGNGFSLQFGASSNRRSEVSFNGNIFRMWVNLGQFIMGGGLDGFSFADNSVYMYGDSAAGGTQYNLSVAPISIANIKNFVIADNVLVGILPLNSVVTYMILGDTSSGTVSANQFPPQNTLTSGNDVSIQGTSTDVVILQGQQTSRRQLTATIPDGTYVANGVLATINTGLTKPRMATVEVYIDNANITNPGAGDMFFQIMGLNGTDQYLRVLSTGNQVLRMSVTGFVSGTLTFKVLSSLQIVLSSSNSYYRSFKVTFI